jgi:diaminopimelate epimerase
MPEPNYKSKNILIENLKGDYIDSGAKHFVTELISKWPNNKNLIEIAKKIRYNDLVFPQGINVNFYKIINSDTIEVKTYEKGVEKLMQSCASGSFASAYVFHKKNNKKNNKINIINMGGNSFIIINKNSLRNKKLSKKKISKICCENKTDGLIIIDYKDINNIIMNYYNNDGTWESLCVNGLACVSILLIRKLSNNKFNINCGTKLYNIIYILIILIFQNDFVEFYRNIFLIVIIVICRDTTPH